MGGAVAVHVAEQKLLPSLAGLAVIDVVEGEEHKVTKLSDEITTHEKQNSSLYLHSCQVQHWRPCLLCSHFSGVDQLHFNHWSKVLNGGK